MIKSSIATPSSSLQEVLYCLITKGKSSIEDFPHLSGFRSRISNLVLDHDLILESEMGYGVNKHGRKFHFAIHILPKSEIENAIIIYNKLQNNERHNKMPK